MKYKIIFFLIFLTSCSGGTVQNKKSTFTPYSSKGFALIYNENLSKIKKLENRSLNIYHKSLKKRSIVKISNPENGKYLIAEVKSNKVRFSNFYNSILSLRIAKQLDLDFDEPYVEIILVSKNSTFVDHLFCSGWKLKLSA